MSKRYRVTLSGECVEVVEYVVEVEANSEEEAKAEALALDDYGPGKWYSEPNLTELEINDVEEIEGSEQ